MRCACFPCHSCHRNVRAWRARVIHGGVAGNRFSSPMPLHGVASFMRASRACVSCLACGSFHVPCFRASCINCRGTESGMSGTNDRQPMHSVGMLPCCTVCAAFFLITRKSGERSAFSAHHAKYFHYGLLQMGSLSYGLSEWPGGGDILLWARCSR